MINIPQIRNNQTTPQLFILRMEKEKKKKVKLDGNWIKCCEDVRTEAAFTLQELNVWIWTTYETFRSRERPRFHFNFFFYPVISRAQVNYSIITGWRGSFSCDSRTNSSWELKGGLLEIIYHKRLANTAALCGQPSEQSHVWTNAAFLFTDVGSQSRERPQLQDKNLASSSTTKWYFARTKHRVHR